MAFTLPPLPYDKTALAPHISAETLEYHHGKHHQAYVTNLNKLIEGKPEANKTLEEIILSSEGGVFNNAAQVWNHTFYWNSMKPNGGGAPTGDLADLINRDFGSFDKFKEEFTAAATTQFGSGWAWLVFADNKLSVTKTGNADLPLKHGQKALLTIDVWEHAYYIDYRNLRPKYIETFLTSLANWEFAAKNLKGLSSLAMRQLAAFLLLLAACDRPKTEPDSVRPVSTASKPGPSVSGPGGGTGASDPAPSAGAAGSPASPLASGPTATKGGGFCSAALTPADIQAACGVAVTLVPGADADDIAGAPGACSRRYAAGGRSLSLVLTRLASPALAKSSFDGQAASRKEEPEFKALTGLGEGARRYVSINLTGDLLSSVEWVTGPYVARVFTPKVASNGNQFEPVCSLDKLEALARTASARLK